MEIAVHSLGLELSTIGSGLPVFKSLQHRFWLTGISKDLNGAILNP
jgi:hypothetical protein